MGCGKWYGTLRLRVFWITRQIRKLLVHNLSKRPIQMEEKTILALCLSMSADTSRITFFMSMIYLNPSNTKVPYRECTVRQHWRTRSEKISCQLSADARWHLDWWKQGKPK